VEVYVDWGALKNPKVNGGASAFKRTTGANHADGSVVGRELLVLLERLAKGVEPLADLVFQTA